jgi:urease accessory protein
MQAGHGQLSFGQGARITRAAARAPLKLLLPRNHGRARWAFVSTLGGGLVDGDVIDLDVHVEAGAIGVLGTQASTKVYRSPVHGATQRLHATIEEDALLCVLPDPVAPFAGSRYSQTQTYHVRGSLVSVDILSCGRAARGERWAFSRWESRTKIGAIDDRVLLDAGDMDLARAMGRFDAIATIFAIGAEIAPEKCDVVFSSSPIPRGRCLRAAAPSVESMLAFVRKLFAPVRDRLGDDPFARKW